MPRTAPTLSCKMYEIDITLCGTPSHIIGKCNTEVYHRTKKGVYSSKKVIVTLVFVLHCNPDKNEPNLIRRVIITFQTEELTRCTSEQVGYLRSRCWAPRMVQPVGQIRAMPLRQEL